MRSAFIVAAAAAVGVSAPPVANVDPRTPSPPIPAWNAGEIPGASLPILKDRRYLMSGAARPLLFWIGRDDIGLARIVWRRGREGARGYELLVGTDPERAPRGLNRWGFITEETLGETGAVLALMTGSHETSYEQEAEGVERGAPGADFRAIRSRTTGGATEWRLARVRTREALTVHQAGDALDLVRTDGRAADRRREIGADVRPGFLIAVADLVEATVAASRSGGGTPEEGVRYVFGEQLYELRVRDTESVRVDVAGRLTPGIETSFETRALGTGKRTRFRLTIGTEGETLGVPLAIEWQPRWWLRVSLRLDAPRAAR